MLFLLSSQFRSSAVSVVFDFNVSLNDVAPMSPILLPVCFMRMEKSGLLMDGIYVLFLLCSPLRLSSVSVVFDFNASLNDAAPVSPMLFPVDLMRMEKSGLLMDVICVLPILSLHHRLSFVSVVFDFSASPNDVAPMSPMPLPVCLMRMEKSGLFMDVIFVLLLFSSPPRWSFASVVLEFNASVNDVAPLSPISLSVGTNKSKSMKERSLKQCIQIIYCED